MNDETQFGPPNTPLLSVATLAPPNLPPFKNGDAKSENAEDLGPDVTQQVARPSLTTMATGSNLLPDLSAYTHTVPEASHLMKEQGCKYYSERKVQRLCSSNEIDSYLLQTTRKGKPITEWLVNGNFLLDHIKKNEVMRDDTPAAISNLATPNPPPFQNAVAKNNLAAPRSVEDIPDDAIEVERNLATPNSSGDASVVTPEEAFVANKPDATVTTNLEQEKFGGRDVVMQSSEVQILIEKAVLRAQLEGKSAELQSVIAIKDKQIVELQVEKREMRENEKLLQRRVFELGELSFKTFQNVSLKGVLTGPKENENSSDPKGQALFGGAGDNPQSHTSEDGV